MTTRPTTILRSQSFSFRNTLPALQAGTGLLTGLSSAFRWDYWWVFAIPWFILNFPGVLLAIPVVAFALFSAGVSGQEWRTPGFFLGWFIGAPTVLSLVFGLIWTRWRRKRIAEALRKPRVQR